MPLIENFTFSWWYETFTILVGFLQQECLDSKFSNNHLSLFTLRKDIYLLLHIVHMYKLLCLMPAEYLVTRTEPVVVALDHLKQHSNSYSKDHAGRWLPITYSFTYSKYFYRLNLKVVYWLRIIQCITQVQETKAQIFTPSMNQKHHDQYAQATETWFS